MHQASIGLSPPYPHLPVHVRAGDSEVGSGLAAALGVKRTRRRFAKKCPRRADGVQSRKGRYTERGGNPEKKLVTARREGWGDREGGAFQRTPEMWMLLASAVSNGDREAR